MAKIDIEILLRVPEGEEMTDERLDALYELGFDDATVLSRRTGQLILALTLEAQGWEAEAEIRAEDILSEMPDADLIDIRLDD